MVKIRNVYGDEYRGRQGNAVYQKFYGRQIRRLWDGRKENRAPQQEEQKKRFKIGLAFWESLSTEEREALREYLREVGSDLTAQQWAVKVALSRPRVTVQQEEVLANLVEWVEGWDAVGWPYRQEITLTNDLSTDLVGYQKLLELDSMEVGAHFDWSRQGADLRFYDEAGNKLKYWVEEWDKENKTAKVWVRVSQIPAQGQATIKMYYGNAQAESESDPEAVFEFFDDFEGRAVDTNKWTYVLTPEVELLDGTLLLKTDARGKGLKAVYTPQTKIVIETKYIWTSGTYCEFGVAPQYGDERNFYLIMISDFNDALRITRYINANEATIASSSFKPVRGRVITLVVVYDPASGYIYGRAEDDSGQTATVQKTDTALSGQQLGLVAFSRETETFVVYYIRVRKYAEQEPSATFGSEEVGQQVQKTTTRVTVKAIEHVAIADVRVFDEQGNEIWRAEGLTSIQNGEITSRVRLPDEVASKGVRALVRSVAGTVDVVNL